MIPDSTKKWSLAHKPQRFSSYVSHACAASHFLDPKFFAVIEDLGETFHWHRKLWEYATIAELGKQTQLSLNSDRTNTAIGFGVGREPLASFFAARGYSVLATDQPIETGLTVSEWTGTEQFAASKGDLWKSDLVNEDTFNSLVEFRGVDMNELPNDLPKCHFMWSSCVVEHLGGLENTLNFLQLSSRLLLPGGTMVHTTEYELSNQVEMADYGHCAVFRPQELMEIFQSLLNEGLEVHYSLHVPNDSYQDCYISKPPYPGNEPHLKLVLQNSITTSFAIIATRPFV